MKKLALTIISTALLTTSLSAVAQTEFGDIEAAQSFGIECFPLAHGVNGLGSKKEVVIPPFTTEQSSILTLTVLNTGSDMVNVRIKFFDENGVQLDSDAGMSFKGKFSSSNSPFRSSDGSGAAILNSFEIGQLVFDNNNFTFYSGLISWQANKCVTAPTLSVEASYDVDESGRFGTRSLLINGGKAF